VDSYELIRRIVEYQTQGQTMMKEITWKFIIFKKMLTREQLNLLIRKKMVRKPALLGLLKGNRAKP
jgi:hypothetical protein